MFWPNRYTGKNGTVHFEPTGAVHGENIFKKALTTLTSALKMEPAYASETSVTLPTSTQWETKE
jgi:hypothetical protein